MTVQCVLAPNPGPMTLQGTNTWILGDRAVGPVLVVDPGPDDEAHLRAVQELAGRIDSILITHRHADHTAGADRLAEIADCPVRAVDPAYRRGASGLGDGEVIAGSGVTITVIATPGHTSDSVCFVVSGGGTSHLLTGDTVLGAGTSVIAAPDGDLGDYLASLQRLRQVVETYAVVDLLPGHGPVVSDPAGKIDAYVRHRRDRLAQVEAALAAGDRTATEVVARVYADVDRSLWPAAEQSVEAQLSYLRRTQPSQPTHP